MIILLDKLSIFYLFCSSLVCYICVVRRTLFCFIIVVTVITLFHGVRSAPFLLLDLEIVQLYLNETFIEVQHAKT